MTRLLPWITEIRPLCQRVVHLYNDGLGAPVVAPKLAGAFYTLVLSLESKSVQFFPG